MSGLAPGQAPDEAELKKRRAELRRLEARLAQKELDLATLQAELHVFETRYIHAVGTLYWELDEIEARIAEIAARLHPDIVDVQHKAAEARARARETAEAVGKAEQKRSAKGGDKPEFVPSDELKQIYREAAKKIHPDLALDDDDRELRHNFMAEANRAYEDGDVEKLKALLAEWETSPEAIRGDDTASRLDRMLKKIERAKQRIESIKSEMLTLQQSELYILKRKVEKAEELGRDLLSDMANRVHDNIEAARKRLDQITKQLEINEQQRT